MSAAARWRREATLVRRARSEDDIIGEEGNRIPAASTGCEPEMPTERLDGM
jgi:hypothetical protein